MDTEFVCSNSNLVASIQDDHGGVLKTTPAGDECRSAPTLPADYEAQVLTSLRQEVPDVVAALDSVKVEAIADMAGEAAEQQSQAALHVFLVGGRMDRATKLARGCAVLRAHFGGDIEAIGNRGNRDASLSAFVTQHPECLLGITADTLRSWARAYAAVCALPPGTDVDLSKLGMIWTLSAEHRMPLVDAVVTEKLSFDEVKQRVAAVREETTGRASRKTPSLGAGQPRAAVTVLDPIRTAGTLTSEAQPGQHSAQVELVVVDGTEVNWPAKLAEAVAHGASAVDLGLDSMDRASGIASIEALAEFVSAGLMLLKRAKTEACCLWLDGDDEDAACARAIQQDPAILTVEAADQAVAPTDACVAGFGDHDASTAQDGAEGRPGVEMAGHHELSAGADCKRHIKPWAARLGPESRDEGPEDAAGDSRVPNYGDGFCPERSPGDQWYKNGIETIRFPDEPPLAAFSRKGFDIYLRHGPLTPTEQPEYLEGRSILYNALVRLPAELEDAIVRRHIQEHDGRADWLTWCDDNHCTVSGCLEETMEDFWPATMPRWLEAAMTEHLPDGESERVVWYLTVARNATELEGGQFSFWIAFVAVDKATDFDEDSEDCNDGEPATLPVIAAAKASSPKVEEASVEPSAPTCARTARKGARPAPTKAPAWQFLHKVPMNESALDGVSSAAS